MSIIRSFFFLALVACVPLQSQEQPKPTERDPTLVDVLTRVVSAAGGAQALAAVHDLTESGQITFHWGKGVEGPVTIQNLGGNHFRMEADLPSGKRTWLENDGEGARKEGDRKPLTLSSGNAVNLGNLTFPIALVVQALEDAKTDVSSVGIETKDSRSIYRIRVKGQLGLSDKPVPGPLVVKDLLIDALDFSILSVEDRPFRIYQGKTFFDEASKTSKGRSDKPSREIDFENFRSVDGVLTPFSITIKLMGQPTLTIHLTTVTFNSNLSPEDFKR